jgi:signal transduction histidine kinase
MSQNLAGAVPERHRARLDRWERREAPVIAVLPYVMLVVASILAVLISPHPRDIAINLGVAALTAAWLLFGFTLHPAWRERPRWMAVFFPVLVVLMAVLVIRAPIYGFFTFTAYFFTYWLPLGKWRVIGVMAVAVLTATSQDGGLPKHEAGALLYYAALILINVAVASGLVWFSFVSSAQSDLRRQAVEDLSEANRKLEATLAENAGLHEQLVAQAREAGVNDERQRMAREIHDTLAQSLAGIITQLQAADQAGHATQAAEQRRHRDAALALARDGLSEARRSVRALRPEPLQQSGRIEDALAVVAARWSALHGVEAAVTSTGPPRPIPAETELVLLRTAQEALANVARHAGARTVRLTLSYIGDQVTLDVRDDGAGFDPAAGPAGGTAASAPPANGKAINGAASHGTAVHGTVANGAAVNSTAGNGAATRGTAASAAPLDGPLGGALGGGFGLIAMRERVEGLTGTLAIESEPGAGTTISASLPVPCPGAAP